jgi:hypothetical protein
VQSIFGAFCLLFILSKSLISAKVLLVLIQLVQEEQVLLSFSDCLFLLPIKYHKEIIRKLNTAVEKVTI